MKITLKELHRIKYALPYGSISLIANQLGVEEQEVNDYFRVNSDISVIDSINQNETVHIGDAKILAMALLILFQNERDGNITLPENSFVEDGEAARYLKSPKQTVDVAVEYVLNKNKELYRRLA